MRVVHVVRQFSPSVGGLESAVLSLARRQVEDLDIQARIVTLDRRFGEAGTLPAIDEVNGLKVARLRWRGSPRYPLAPAVLAHLHEADLVHVHGIDFFFDFLALTWPLHRRNLIASTHGGFFHTAKFARLKNIWFRTVTRASAQAYHRIIACSHSDRELFKAHGSRLALIENGVDLDKFSRAAAAHQTRTMIYFGRFTEHKRIHALFPVMTALRRLHPDWRLIVAGRPEDQSLAALAAMAGQAGAADAVAFVDQPGDHQLHRLIGQASFFACLSRYEGFGIAAVEAMSAGLVPVLSQIPPFLRLRDHAPDALIIDPAEPEAVANRLEAQILSDEAHAARQARLTAAAARYDWRHVARQYAAIYDETLNPKPHSAPAKLGWRV